MHTFKKMAEHPRDGMVTLFNIPYYVIKRGHPFTDYPGLVDLHKKNGVNLPSCYHSNKACARYLVDIHAEICEDILQDMREARYLSVLIDGSTDCAILEMESVYVRFVATPFSAKRKKSLQMLY